MSVKVKQEWGKQRAVWSLAEEQVLMELFDKARHDPELRTKKGLKPCGWEAVVEEVNNRCKSTFNIDQLRSKSSRLMMDYELFEDVGGERSLTEEAWDKVIESMPENAKRLAQFKECGFPLADICRRISLGKEELPEARPWASSVVGTKRPSPSDEELPEAKKSRDEVKTAVGGWGIREEKLLMFLCWRAKTDKEKEGTEPWLEVTNKLNKNSQINFNQEQVKSKYLQVMQEYEQFKRATGFTGASGTAPKYKKDWKLLMKERPECSVELEKLMKKGGFPHVEVCSLVKGDKATDNVEPTSLTDYLATGALQQVNSTKALPHILPATPNSITVKPSATGAKPAVTAAVTPVVAPVAAAVAPAVFTQELHDNMNMFLKTATAYLVMLIDDHNKRKRDVRHQFARIARMWSRSRDRVLNFNCSTVKVSTISIDMASQGRRRNGDGDGDAAAAAASPRSSFVLLEENLSPNLLRSTHSDGGRQQSRPAPIRAPQSQSLHSLRRLYPPAAPNDDDGTRSEGGTDRRRRLDSISDLFPMTGVGVFTNPANIMPTREASILIDTDVQQAAAQDAAHRLGMQPAGASILHSVMEQKTDGRGSRVTSASGHNGSFEGDSLTQNAPAPSENTRSRSSFLDGIPPMEPADRGTRWALRLRKCFKCQSRRCHHWRPKQRLVSLWRRMVPNWDSLVLKGTLILALLSVPVAVVIAAVLSHAAPDKVHMVARCAVPGSMESYSASTAYVAGVLIPAMNNFVFLIVSFWLGMLCSRSRKRVLRSAPCSISSNLKSAFMLPCYEAIWYTISALSAIGLVLYFVSFQAYKSDSGKSYSALTLDDDPSYPCSLVTMPSVWVLQLLPMLMIQRSVSQEAVLRAILYSGGVCVIFVICNMTLYKVGHDIADIITMTIHVLLLVFYFWAKFVFHARATFDFFFVAAVTTSITNITSSVMGLAHVDATSTLPIVHCVVFGLDSLIVVAVLLSLRADTRYWLAIDDNGSGTTASSSAMRRYMNLLSERGMITNFSTRTSVYDVHHMIEEHRHNVVDFSALALDCIIAQGATSIVMRGTMRRSTPVPIALKIYTDVQVTNEEVQRFSRETALNVQLSHPNVVRFYGLCVVPPSISLIFEFCEYGSLDVTLRENPEIWTLAAKLKAWLDACRAVAYLHSFSPPLLHRDIKTDNFLVGQDFLIKLADFGEANLLRPRTDGTMTIAGTVDYMAPEMIKGGKTARYGTAVDVYSLMITLWQIMVPSRSPWESKSHLEVYRSVANGERPPLLPSIPKACAEILEAGWAANPGDRVAAEDIIPSVHRLWLLAMHQKPLKRTKHFT